MAKEWFKSFFNNDYWLTYNFVDSKEKTNREARFIEKALKLNKNNKILDLCCGYGRHSIQLRKKGYNLFGYDLSPDLLKKAKIESGKQNANFYLVRGDARNLSFQNRKFDKAFNFKTSFGYFKDSKEDYKLLEEVSRVLKPGGLLLLDTKNKNYVTKHLVPFEKIEINNVGVENRQRLDSKTGCIITERKMVFLDGRKKRYIVRNRFYTPKRLQKMLENAGFVVKTIYGSYAGEKFNTSSPRMIVIAKKVKR